MLNIKQFREETGLSQIALARRSRISRSRIQMAEAGYLALNEKEIAAIDRVLGDEIREKSSRFKALIDKSEMGLTRMEA